MYHIVTGSCRPFQRSARKRFELDVDGELYVVFRIRSFVSMSVTLVQFSLVQ